jgi:hypothetical protein
MNIPGIIKIEYINAENASIAFSPSTSVDASNFSGNWTDVSFVDQTGGFTCQEKKQGLFETNLNFSIPEINNTIESLVKELTTHPKVYRCTDVQGTMFIVGSNHFKGRAKSIMKNNVPFSSFRGFDIEVTVNSTHKPLIYDSSADASE